MAFRYRCRSRPSRVLVPGAGYVVASLYHDTKLPAKAMGQGLGTSGCRQRVESPGMEHRYVLSDYVEEALALALYDKLDDGSFAGKIPGCTGVIAFAENLRECERELRSTLEDWVLVGLKLGHELHLNNFA